MEIRVIRSGGFVGGLPQRFSLSAEQLGERERAELSELVRAAETSVPAEPGGLAPDSFRYEVSVVQHAGEKTFAAADTDSPAVRRLAQWIIARAPRAP